MFAAADGGGGLVGVRGANLTARDVFSKLSNWRGTLIKLAIAPDTAGVGKLGAFRKPHVVGRDW